MWDLPPALTSFVYVVVISAAEFLSRWIPFPNFSFEIVRHRDGNHVNNAAPFVVTPEMVQQVWEVFPQYSAESIRADLMRTRSPERTIERILNGSFEAQREQGAEGGDLGDIAQVIDDIDEDLRWSVSTLWTNLWSSERQQPIVDRNGNVAEHIAIPENRNDGFPNGGRNGRNGAAETETLLRRLQRWREDER